MVIQKIWVPDEYCISSYLTTEMVSIFKLKANNWNISSSSLFCIIFLKCWILYHRYQCLIDVHSTTSSCSINGRVFGKIAPRDGNVDILSIGIQKCNGSSNFTCSIELENWVWNNDRIYLFQCFYNHNSSSAKPGIIVYED